MSALESLLRARGEDILFAAFFLTIAGLALLETRASMPAQGLTAATAGPPTRR
jgi:hypothetical protein